MNPYWGADFIDFFLIFFARLFAICVGKISFADMASDEVQIFVLGLIAIASACVGTLLVVKRVAMLANAISHTILLGIVISYFLLQWCSLEKGHLVFNHQMFFVAAVITALVTTALTDLCKRVFKLQEEASVGLVFTLLFALGVVLVTVYSRNVHLGAEVIMGNIDALHLDDVQFFFFLAAANVALVALCFKQYQILAFDEGLAKTLGCHPTFFQYLLMMQTSLIAVGAFRAVGAFLFLIFLTAPVMASRLVTHKLSRVMVYASLISLVCILVGVAITRHLLTVYEIALSTAGVTSVCAALSLPCVWLGVKARLKVLKTLQKRNLSLHNVGAK